MKILAIETSCDETGISIINATGEYYAFSFTILGDSINSQAALHSEYGGVYPSLAKREHAKNLVPTLLDTLTQSKLLTQHTEAPVSKNKLDEMRVILEREPELFARLTLFLAEYAKPPIDAIAVTHGPGLAPALWVGVNFARALSLVWNIPIIPVNHMEGHLVSSVTDFNTNTLATPTFPTLALLISGGHTELILMKDWMDYEKIGKTRDDAIGEAFDKVARLLGLPYPGGPEISKLAEAARNENLSRPYSLPRPMSDSDDYDFSFSGLKTAVRLLTEGIDIMDDTKRKQIAREFEDAVTDVCIKKTTKALEEYGITSLIIGGGVSANTHIIEKFKERIKDEYTHITLYVPPLHVTGDNALMIALAGYMRAQQNEYISGDDLVANGNLSIAE